MKEMKQIFKYVIDHASLKTYILYYRSREHKTKILTKLSLNINQNHSAYNQHSKYIYIFISSIYVDSRNNCI